MKTEKFDNRLKEHFEGRTVQPSGSAWAKLSKQLDSERKKSQKRIRWVGVAAVFLLGIAIGGLVFKQQTNHPEKTEIAKENLEKQSIETENPKLNKALAGEKTKNAQKTDSKIHSENSPLLTKGKKTEKKPVREKVLLSSNDREKQSMEPTTTVSLAVSGGNKASVSKLTSKTQHPLEEGANKIIGKIVGKKDLAKTTDAEIEALLQQARLEIQKEELFGKDQNQISAQNLLESVERELAPSFKEKLFDFVGEKIVQLASTGRVQ